MKVTMTMQCRYKCGKQWECLAMYISQRSLNILYIIITSISINLATINNNMYQEKKIVIVVFML